MAWSVRVRSASMSPRAAKDWKVPTRMWLAATRVSTAPGSGVSRKTVSPVVTAASARVVGTPSACIASRHDVFAQHRAEPGAPVAAARERRAAGALELDVAALAVAVDDLAEQERAAVAELGHEVAELVAGVEPGERLGALGHLVAGEESRRRPSVARASGSRPSCSANAQLRNAASAVRPPASARSGRRTPMASWSSCSPAPASARRWSLPWLSSAVLVPTRAAVGKKIELRARIRQEHVGAWSRSQIRAGRRVVVS